MTFEQSRLYALYDSDPSPEVEFLRFLVASYDLPDPPRMLDVGCGPGRLLGPLDDLGWAVTGLEPDPDYAAAAIRTVRALRHAEARRGGFGEIGSRAGEYDLIAAVNGPYSYLLTFRERREAIENSFRALRPGGVLFLHYSNFWWILRHYREPEPLQIELDGTRVTRTAFHDIDYHIGRFTHHDVFRWTDSDGESRTVTKRHQMAMTGPPEVEGLLQAAGFHAIRTFNDYADREPAPLHGQRVMIAARKPRQG